MTQRTTDWFTGVDSRREFFRGSNTNPVYVDGGAGDDAIFGGDPNDTLIGGLGADYVVGGAGNDTIYGDRTWRDEAVDAAPELSAGGDFLLGGDGDDVIYAGGGRNFASGGAGDDVVIAGGGADLLEGGEGDDRLEGGGGADRLFGGTTTISEVGDWIAARGAFTTEFNGDDSAQTRSHDLSFYVTFDRVASNTGFDYLDGGDGDDLIDGGDGADIMLGGLGADRYYVDNGQDIIREYAGEGNDYVFCSTSYTLKGGVEVERMLTTNNNGTGVLNLSGNEFGQQIFGNAANNKLVGNGGDDRLTGFGGNDALYGGTGKDTLVGGVGNDSFILDAATGSTNIDVISDFTEATGNNDVIRLDDAIFAALSPGETGFFRSNATGLAEGLNDHIIFNTTNGRLYYDANGSQAGGAVQIAQITLVGSATLGEDDFIIF